VIRFFRSHRSLQNDEEAVFARGATHLSISSAIASG